MWKLILALLSTSLGSIQDCSNGLSTFKLTSLALVPESPLPGENVNMIVQFTNPGPDVNNGSVSTSITYNFLPLTPTVESLCDNTDCPLVNGFNDRSTNTTWPDISGIVTSTIVWNAFDNSQLLCIKLSVKSGLGNLRGNKVYPGISFFKKNKEIKKHFILSDLVVYRQWDKSKRTTSYKSPEDL